MSECLGKICLYYVLAFCVYFLCLPAKGHLEGQPKNGKSPGIVEILMNMHGLGDASDARCFLCTFFSFVKEARFNQKPFWLAPKLECQFRFNTPFAFTEDEGQIEFEDFCEIQKKTLRCARKRFSRF